MNKVQRSEAVLLAELSEGLELVALRLLGSRDEAQDAVQEVMVRLLAVLGSKGVPAGYTLEKYAYGILKHVVTDMQRRQKRFISLPSWLATRAPAPLEQIAEQQAVAILKRALAQLDHADRELLERCYLAGERVVEIARATGEPAERIRKRKSRALERLRHTLSEHSHVFLQLND